MIMIIIIIIKMPSVIKIHSISAFSSLNFSPSSYFFGAKINCIPRQIINFCSIDRLLLSLSFRGMPKASICSTSFATI